MRVGRSHVLWRGGGGSCWNGCACVMLALLLGTLAVVVPWFAFSCERERFLMTAAFEEIHHHIQQLPSDMHPSAVDVDHVVHFQSSNIVPSTTLQDPDLGVTVPKALALRREVEYCQWQELIRDEVRSASGGPPGEREETVVRTYYYVKGWHSHRIPSLFFDQPFHHNNPQRDPLPSQEWRVPSAKAGHFVLPSALLDRMSSYSTLQVQIDTSNAVDAKVEQHGDTVIVPLSDLVNSVASQQHGFKYVGDGYFYSPYEASAMETVSRIAGSFLEGSLFDFQLGDLFSVCNAGDIRIRFSSISPSTISVLAEQQDEQGNLGLHTTSRGYHVGSIHVGKHTSRQMMDEEIRQNWWITFWSRLLLVAWSLALSALLSLELITGTLVIASLSLGSMWLIIWGASGSPLSLAMVLLGVSGLFLFLFGDGVFPKRSTGAQ